MFEPKPLWFRIFMTYYMVGVIAWPIATLALLGYALWTWNTGLLAVALTSAAIIVLAVFLIWLED